MTNQNRNSNNFINALKGAKFSGAIFCFMIILYVSITFIGQFILSAIKINEQSTIYLAVSGCFSTLAIFIVLMATYTSKKQNFKSLLSVNKCNYTWYIIAILLFIGMFFGLGYVNIIFTDYLNEIFNIQSLDLSSNFTLIKFLVLTLILAILPAVFEELFFRGLLLNTLIPSGKVFAIILSSICFSIYHCSITQLIYQFIFGVAFSLIALNSKSVVPCMVAHFLNNFIILLAYYLKINGAIYNVVTIIIGFLSLAIFITLIALKSIKNIPLLQTEKDKNTHAIKDFIYPYGIVGVVICLALIIFSII